MSKAELPVRDRAVSTSMFSSTAQPRCSAVVHIEEKDVAKELVRKMAACDLCHGYRSDELDSVRSTALFGIIASAVRQQDVVLVVRRLQSKKGCNLMHAWNEFCGGFRGPKDPAQHNTADLARFICGAVARYHDRFHVIRGSLSPFEEAVLKVARARSPAGSSAFTPDGGWPASSYFGGSSAQWRPGDWYCETCGDLQFAARSECRTCKASSYRFRLSDSSTTSDANTRWRSDDGWSGKDARRWQSWEALCNSASSFSEWKEPTWMVDAGDRNADGGRQDPVGWESGRQCKNDQWSVSTSWQCQEESPVAQATEVHGNEREYDALRPPTSDAKPIAQNVGGTTQACSDERGTLQFGPQAQQSGRGSCQPSLGTSPASLSFADALETLTSAFPLGTPGPTFGPSNGVIDLSSVSSKASVSKESGCAASKLAMLSKAAAGVAQAAAQAAGSRASLDQALAHLLRTAGMTADLGASPS